MSSNSSRSTSIAIPPKSASTNLSSNPRRAYGPNSRTSTMDADLDGWKTRDETALLHDSLPVYKPKTLLCDWKVREQYIDYLRHCVKVLPVNFKDSPGPYFETILDTVLDDTPVEDLPYEDVNPGDAPHPTEAAEAAAAATHSTAPPKKNDAPITPRTIRTVTTTTIRTIIEIIQQPDGSTVHRSSTVMPPEITTEEISLSTHSAVATTSPLFSFDRIVAYITNKMKSSKQRYEDTARHCFSLDGMLDRYLPSLRRQFEYQCLLRREVFNATEFKLMKDDLRKKLEALGLPISNKEYFPILRPMMAYMSNLYPHGKSWFGNLMAYVALMYLGPRGGSLFKQRWGSILHARVFPKESSPELMEEITLEFDNYKGCNPNEKFQYTIGNIHQMKSGHPQEIASAPCPVFWLNTILKEQSGGRLSVITFFQQKSLDTPLYHEWKDRYIFPSSKTNTVPLNFVEEDKRCASMSIMYNDHLREVALFCGFQPDLLAKITLHQSIRSGAYIEARAKCVRDQVHTSTPHSNFGWRSNSTIGIRRYDRHSTSNTATYANVSFSILPSDLPTHATFESYLPSSSSFNNSYGTIKHNDLVHYLEQTTHQLGKNVLYRLPESQSTIATSTISTVSPVSESPALLDSSLFAEHNKDLLSKILHSIQEDDIQAHPDKAKINAYVDLQHAVVLAAHKMQQKGGKPCFTQQYEVSKRYLLSKVFYMRRDVMGEFFYSTLRPFSNIHASWKDKWSAYVQTVQDVTILEPLMNQRTLNKDHRKNLSDAYIQEVIEKINAMKVDDLIRTSESINAQSPIRHKDSGTHQKQMTMWNLLSFLIFGSLEDSAYLQNRAHTKCYTKMLRRMEIEDLLSPGEMKEYVSAMEERKAFKKNAVSITSLPSWDQSEFELVYNAFPNIKFLYGWTVIFLAFCPTIRRGGYTKEQISDHYDNHQKAQRLKNVDIERKRKEDERKQFRIAPRNLSHSIGHAYKPSAFNTSSQEIVPIHTSTTLATSVNRSSLLTINPIPLKLDLSLYDRRNLSMEKEVEGTIALFDGTNDEGHLIIPRRNPFTRPAVRPAIDATPPSGRDTKRLKSSSLLLPFSDSTTAESTSFAMMDTHNVIPRVYPSSHRQPAVKRATVPTRPSGRNAKRCKLSDFLLTSSDSSTSDSTSSATVPRRKSFHIPKFKIWSDDSSFSDELKDSKAPAKNVSYPCNSATRFTRPLMIIDLADSSDEAVDDDCFIISRKTDSKVPLLTSSSLGTSPSLNPSKGSYSITNTHDGKAKASQFISPSKSQGKSGSKHSNLQYNSDDVSRGDRNFTGGTTTLPLVLLLDSEDDSVHELKRPHASTSHATVINDFYAGPISERVPANDNITIDPASRVSNGSIRTHHVSLAPEGAFTGRIVATASNMAGIQRHRSAPPAENAAADIGRETNDVIAIPKQIALLGAPHLNGVGNNIAPNGGAIAAGNNHPIPRYTGGFQYNNITFTYTAHSHNGLAAAQHGMVQAANNGHGLVIDPNNLLFNNHHRYNPNWVRPLVLGNCFTTLRETGWCMACSYKLVNPLDQERQKYYSPTPASPHPNYAYYLHYPCAHSHLVNYNTVRFNAIMALYNPNQLSWAVSQNNGSQGRGQKWSYMEVVDLFIALRLSGQLQADFKDWNLVLRYAPVLQVRGRNTQMIARKFHQMNKEEGYVHLFTADFHNTILGRNPQFDPPHPPAL